MKGNDLPRFLILIFPYNHYGGGGGVMKIITANKGGIGHQNNTEPNRGISWILSWQSLPLPSPPTPSFLVTNDQSLKSILINLLKYITMQLILNIAELIWGSHAVSRKTAKDFTF